MAVHGRTRATTRARAAEATAEETAPRVRAERGTRKVPPGVLPKETPEWGASEEATTRTVSGARPTPRGRRAAGTRPRGRRGDRKPDHDEPGGMHRVADGGFYGARPGVRHGRSGFVEAGRSAGRDAGK